MCRKSFIKGLVVIVIAANLHSYNSIPNIIQAKASESDVIEMLKDEIHCTRNWNENCEDDTIEISYDDAQILLKIAYAEAGNQGIEGQLKIMQTVWNRVQSDDPCFPDTIHGVVYQKGMFSSVTNGSFDAATPTWETHQALALFESNQQHDSEIIGFESKNNGKTLLKYFDYLYEFGDHIFYKLKQH